MAYPGGGTNYSEHVEQVIKEYTGIKYARTTICSYDLKKQQNLYCMKPSVYHIMDMEEMFKLGGYFLENHLQEPQVLYIWGHSYEFDIHNTWNEFEEFLKMISGRNDIFYGTNKEVFIGEK